MPNLPRQSDYLQAPIEHLDITAFNAVPLVEGMAKMAFQARNLARGAKIVNRMISENDCTTFLTLSGCMISSGLKKALLTMIDSNMIDCIVSTGANMVDMDFFEGLGFRHYMGDPCANDEVLRQVSIDRIYDTYISEHDLRVCDAAVAQVADRLPPRAYSSREFMIAMGEYLAENNLGEDSIVRRCYEKKIPIFIPSLSDCSAGFGLVMHQKSNPDAHISHDSVKDFSELGEIVVASKSDTGLFMLGGGVPKNFIQDTVVLADMLGKTVPMHKYAVQVTVADERDGALSGSTLKEAHSWGKVEEGTEQMIFSEATLALPLIASYVYHKGAWKQRDAKERNNLFANVGLLPEQQVSPGKTAFEVAKKDREAALATS